MANAMNELVRHIRRPHSVDEAHREKSTQEMNRVGSALPPLRSQEQNLTQGISDLKRISSPNMPSEKQASAITSGRLENRRASRKTWFPSFIVASV